MTVQASNKAVARRKTTATAVSPRQSKKTTSKGKSVSCPKDFQTMPFSKMLGLLQDLDDACECTTCTVYESVCREREIKSLLK